MTRKLPVFFHIPKNAGTYVYNYAFWSVFINTLKSKNPCNLEVIRDGVIAYRLICNSEEPLDSSIYKRMNRGYWRRIELDQLNFDDLNVFFIEVCDSSFSNYRDEIYSKLKGNTLTYEFLCLREPYDRIHSLYSYIQSTQSLKETTHMRFGESSFVEYLNSSQLEGSWLLRNLLNISNEIPVTQEHFNNTCNILDHIYIFNTDDIDQSLGKVFTDCYGISTSNINRKVYDNKTIDKVDVPFDSLDKKTKKAFLKQTYWDYKIYNKYTKC